MQVEEVGMDDPVNRDERRELWPESWWLVGLFGLLTARAIVVPPLRPSPKQAGMAEIAATVVVAAISLAVL